MDRIISNLRSNYVTGSTLMKFSDEEWRELISSMGLRVHIREALKTVMKAKEKVVFRSCIDECFPNHQQRESHLSSAKAMFSLCQMIQSSTILIKVFPDSRGIL